MQLKQLTLYNIFMPTKKDSLRKLIEMKIQNLSR